MHFLIFVRHGETDWNREKRFQGGSSDVPLSLIGEKQSRLIAHAFLREDVRIVFSSPLKRARDTAEIISVVNQIPVEVLPELRELNFGIYEGKLESELERQFGEEYIKWRQSNYTIAPPGGESLADASERVKKILATVEPCLKDGGVILCAHQGINMAIKAFITGDYSIEAAQKYRQPNNRIDYWNLEEKKEYRRVEVFGSFAGLVGVAPLTYTR